MSLVLKDLILRVIIFSDFHLNYLAFGMILLVLEGDLPEEELALENTIEKQKLI